MDVGSKTALGNHALALHALASLCGPGRMHAHMRVLVARHASADWSHARIMSRMSILRDRMLSKGRHALSQESPRGHV